MNINSEFLWSSYHEERLQFNVKWKMIWELSWGAKLKIEDIFI